MEYTTLGRSGAKVSRICLGTMNFGPVIDEESSFEIMDRAFDHGINFFDTADVYGGAPWGDLPGQTEEIVGRWLAARGLRDQVVISTKVHGEMGAGPNDRGLSALHIRAGVDASLRRLQTDRIDVYHMHHIDRSVPVDEVLDAFTRLRDAGKIVYLASSNFPGWCLARYSDTAENTGKARIVAEQSVYNLAQRIIELEVIPAAEQYGIGLLPWSPLASGKLGGVLQKTDRSRSSLDALGSWRPQIEAYEAFAGEIGVPPAELGLAWLLHQPAVTAPIVGPRRLEHLLSAIRALKVTLKDAELSRLDEIWPGPGVAPEAYAW